MRRFTIGALVSAIGVVAALSIPARAQAPAPAASSAAPAKPYTTPKTPWGDPDISGTWSSDDLRNTPVQRPVELGNRSQLSDDEYAKRLADADRRAVQAAGLRVSPRRADEGDADERSDRDQQHPPRCGRGQLPDLLRHQPAEGRPELPSVPGSAVSSM